MAGDGSAVYADGFDANAALVNNLLIGADGQTALHCGNFNDANPPIVRFNDIFTLASPAYGGLCTDQTGVNGNVSVDPAFVDPAMGDYRLQAISPVIDAGDSTAPDVPASDLDGDLRVVDGNGDGVAVVDMGAYERHSGRVSRVTSADGILAPSSRNLNDGANPRLVVDTHRTVVAFDLSGIAAAGLSRVTLRLTLAEPATSWGGAGRFVSVHRLGASFAEGNGQWFGLPSESRTRGSGPGVTWNCAVDSSIANTSADCAALWNGGSSVAGSASASTLHTNGLTGALEWDVTADVVEALAENAISVQWLIRRAAENQSGRAIYHSREGAAALGNADLAPTLTFEF